MNRGAEWRARWGVRILGMIALGIFSRMVRTGFVVWDKYLGDALYAAMVYGIWRWFVGAGGAARGAAVTMTAIEVFQLTLIPARMLGSDSWVVRIAGRLLGVQFGWLDLVAYGVGIGSIYLADSLAGGRRAALRNETRNPPGLIGRTD